MIINVDLHYRSNASDEHRHLGAVTVEIEGSRLEPYRQILWHRGDEEIHAQITSIQERSDRLPHVYADAVHSEALAG